MHQTLGPHEKHEEAAAFYADLKATIEGYYEGVDHRDQTDKLVKKTMNHLDKISQAGVDERAKLLKTLNKVSETFKADSALKEAMQKMAESNNTTSSSIINVEMESKHQPRVTQPISITIVRPLTKPAYELEVIGSSSRIQLTDTILEPDRGKDKVTDDAESPPKLVKASYAYYELEERNPEATIEANLLELTKPEFIKVIHEEAAKTGIDPKILASAKGGQEWATSSKLKPKTITDIDIHPNTKPVVVTVFRGNDQRNFNAFNPFKFDDFGERLKKIPEELGITPTLPDPGQILSLTSGRKRKIQEIGDIHKVDVETQLTYLVMASNIRTPKNQRFCMALRSLINSYLDKKKLESKRVKLEAVGYKLE
ncbi:hypothetical protein Tco_0110777 [Tanacetum coccineum]